MGGEAISKIRQIKADLCFLGTNAIDIPNGLTDSDWEVVQIKSDDRIIRKGDIAYHRREIEFIPKNKNLPDQ